MQASNEQIDVSLDEEEEPPTSGMEIHFTKEDFDNWMTKMTVSKFNHYMAWFNINIKQVNS